jgi:peptidoglycan hydrolase CwlO-like protein
MGRTSSKSNTIVPQELSPDTKFTLSIQTMIGAGMGIASLVGMWYVLQADIQEAKELPVPLSLFSQEYPSKGISDFNWSPSYEQYKQQVGNLQENQDDIYEIVEGLQEEIKELNRQITNLRIAVQ